MPSTRRAVLVAVASGLAGCTAMPERTDQRPQDEERPATKDRTATGDPRQSDDCAAGFHVSLAPFAPSDDLPIRVDGHRALIAAAVDGGTSVEMYGQEPLDGGVVAHDGAYYRLSVEQVARTRVTAYLFDVTWEEGRTAPEEATVLAFGNLPGSDRGAVRFLVPDGDGAEDGGHPTEEYTGRERPVPYPDGGDDSVLLDYDTVWVRHDGREYHLSPGAETTTEAHRYRYTVDRLADSEGSLRAWAAETYLVDLSPSVAQEDLLAKASKGTYRECAPASDALAGIQDQVAEDARLPQPADGWYVDVDGDRHLLTITRWVA